MRVLYAIQGTGNGHAARARDIVPILKKKVDCDVLISGIQCDLKTFDFPVDYQLKGLSFIFGKSGGVDLLTTFLKTNLFRFAKEVNTLPVEKYDLIINDFEPVSAWAAKLKRVPIVSVSHQSAVLAPNAPRPSYGDWKGEFILKNYAPINQSYGFHFQSYNKGISTPVIRQEIRNTVPTDKGHFTVYLPAYSDEVLLHVLSQIVGTQWHVFSKHCRQEKTVNNVKIEPVDNDAFIKSFAECRGILCGAGFETPAEALFLGKQLAVIPMKGQYEQHLNAAALEEMGVCVLADLPSSVEQLQKWVKSKKAQKISYPDNAEKVINRVLHQNGQFDLENKAIKHSFKNAASTIY